MSTPPLLKEGGVFVRWNDPNGNPLIAVNRDGTIFSQGLKFQNGSQTISAVQTSRVSTTIAPGLSTVDLLWGQPFNDNSYFVLFPNPPFAPGAIDPIPPANTRTDAWTSTIDSHFAPQYGTFDIASSKLEIATVDAGNNRASMGWVELNNWAANQYAQLKITATESGAGALGPAIYVQDGAFYAFYIEAGVAYLFKQAGLVTTVLGSTAATLSVNDILSIEIAGQTLTAKQNGIVILTAFEVVPLPVGNPGVNGRLTSTLRANDWQAGNLQIPIVAVIPVVLGPWVYLPNGTGVTMTLQNLNLQPLQVQIDVVGIQAS
jgi:hypothetical protein